MNGDVLTYQVVVQCQNCGYEGKVEITRGCAIGQRACPSCGCATLERVDGVWAYEDKK